MADKRLIDANVVINDIQRYNKENFNRPDWSSKQVCELLKNATTVDAVPVVHGRWIQPDFILTEFWKCTACGVEWYMEDDGGWNYCPNCGAKMDGERSEGE